jgi:hypothetical protein
MDPLLALLAAVARGLRDRLTVLRERPDAGYSTETVLITALLVALGLTALAVISAKVMAKVRSIDLQ